MTQCDYYREFVLSPATISSSEHAGTSPPSRLWLPGFPHILRRGLFDHVCHAHQQQKISRIVVARKHWVCSASLGTGLEQLMVGPWIITRLHSLYDFASGHGSHKLEYM